MTADCSWYGRLKKPVFLWWTAAFATQLVVDRLFKYTELHSPIRFLLGLLPPLMWILVIVAFVRAVFKLDELQQRIHMQAVSIASVLATILILLFSGLQRAGIYHGTWSAVSSSLMLLLMISYVFSAWRYR